MYKKYLFLLFAIFIPISLVFAEESITLTTYYPSPYGNFDNLTTNNLTIEGQGNITINGFSDLLGDGINRGVIYGPRGRSFSLALRDNQPTTDRFSVIIDPDGTGGADTEALVVRGDGRVGIGTTAPYEKLHIEEGAILAGTVGSTNGSLILAGKYSGANNYLNTFGGHHSSGGTVIAYAVKPLNGASGYASSTSVNVPRTAINLDGDVSFLSAAAQIVAQNSVVTMTPRVTIKNSGNVGIGITNPAHLIHLNGGAYSDGAAWTPASDKAYKKDINYDFKYGLQAIERLKPVYYVHKQDKTSRKQIGFIAQDVLEVIPELVSGEEGSYGLSYDQLTAVLANAIKEQQAQINKLQFDNKQLNIRLSALEEKNTDVKK